MANKIIYAVTSGDYSGYQIEALFSTQKKAEEYIENTYDPDYHRIEEYVLDGERPNREEKLFHVSIGYEDFNAKISDRYEKNCFRAEEFRDTFHLSDSGEYVEMYFVTTEPKRALKIASEWLAQIKAEEWRYPLMHTKCTFVDEDAMKYFKKEAPYMIPYLSIKERYPTYRFGTGLVVVPKGEQMIVDTKKKEE